MTVVSRSFSSPLALFLVSLLASSCVSHVNTPRVLGEDDDSQWHGHFSYPIGYRDAGSDFEDADDQLLYGLADFDLKPPGSPVHVVFQLLGSGVDDSPDDSPGQPFEFADDTAVTQFNLGLRKYWDNGAWQPYIGGGVSFVYVDVTEDHYYYYDDEIDDDSTIGGWFGAGVLYSPGDSGFHMGLGVQSLFGAEVELLDEDYDVDALDVYLLLGFSF